MKDTRKATNQEMEVHGDAHGNAHGNANLPIGSAPPGAATTPASGTANHGSGAANQEIGAPEIGAPGGAPAAAARWHSRGYLPHLECAQLIQHVTFHLADSLPKEVVERLEAELKSLPPEKQDAERRKRLEAWLDAGHGSCVLRAPGMGDMVQNTFLFFDGQRYRLLAWVVMPNHVHVLFQPLAGWTVAKIVASWKKFTARKICEHRRSAGSAGSANLPIGRDETAIQENGVPGVPGVAPVWHREYWDRFMRNENHLAQAIDYIHKNPVKARLVNSPEEWLWSSAAVLREGGGSEANREIGAPGGAPDAPGSALEP